MADARQLVSVEEVMEVMDLGPNGALLHCMAYLESNMDWLKEALGDDDDDYILVDCPGAVSALPLTHLGQAKLSSTHTPK